jgi:hypothetical protein
METTNGRQITWSPEPPTERSSISIELRRCPARGKLTAIILSDFALWTQTHYFHGRTQPCGGQACEACAQGAARRTVGYVAVMAPATGERFLLQLTDLAAEAINARMATHRTLRGALLEQERPDGRKNGRVRTRIGSPKKEWADLPPTPLVAKIMAQIWEIPYEEPPQSISIKTGTAG